MGGLVQGLVFCACLGGCCEGTGSLFSWLTEWWLTPAVPTVPAGGGAALLHLSELVPEFKATLNDPEEIMGADIVMKALRAPARIIAGEGTSRHQQQAQQGQAQQGQAQQQQEWMQQ